MNLTPDPEERRFREEVRTWLHANIPRQPRPVEGPEMAAFDQAWQRRQFDGGWAGIHWPVAYGGRGLSLVQQLIWYEEYARAEAPNLGSNFIGLQHAGPVLIDSGSEALKQHHLGRILRGEEIWCQGFSEPGAGSDLAALRTRGVVDGDDLVVTGQKIWTSYAHVSHVQELLVRTDPQAQRHRGLSWVVCDMKTPGITVRPLRTISGRIHFCEVFYDEARIPLTNVVGGLGNGWKVAMSTLAWERGTAFISEQVELARTVDHLVDEARRRTGPDGLRPALQHEELREQLAAARAEVRALRAMTVASVSRIGESGMPGAEASIIRLYFSELNQRVRRLALRVLGPRAMETGNGYEGWGWSYVDAFRYTIAAGTAEIQRNIIGERVLGLPR
ncbi:MAG TPA: acyl-CoA dehydrogenase family protein [Ramlibacter sp.]|nr:acyl-CoA dehydrogenase family protein [Ramlibacter sp.]